VARGGHVFTNVELSLDGFRDLVVKSFRVKPNLEKQLHFLTGDQIPLFHRAIAAGDMSLPVLVVIDEAHLWFNAREWAKTSKELLTFLTQSRKVSIDIIFITQAATNIDKQFRSLIQYLWAFKDLRKLLSWWPLPSIMCCRFDVDGQTLQGWNIIRKRQLVFDAYDTNALLKPIDFGGEKLSAVLLEKVPAVDLSRWRARLRPFAFGIGCVLLFLLKGRMGL
jgi:hypothetical protein